MDDLIVDYATHLVKESWAKDRQPKLYMVVKLIEISVIVIIFFFPFLFLFGIIATVLIFLIRKKFKFAFPRRNIDTQISLKKVRAILNSGKIENPKLAKMLRVLIFVDYLLKIIYTLVLLSFAILLLSRI